MGGGQSQASAHPVDTYSRNGETWLKFLDESTNEPYWVNENSRDTVFEEPAVVKLIVKERERHAALYGEDSIDDHDKDALKKSDRAASIRRLDTVEKLVAKVEKADKEDSTSRTLAALVKSTKSETNQKEDNTQALAEEQATNATKARLRVEAENEVQRFVDWLQLNRARVDYEENFGHSVPLEIRFRAVLIKDVADITMKEIKELRSTRQSLTEEWEYDEAKILMVQSAYRKRKGTLEVHMLRQARRRRIDEHAKEIEAMEEDRRQRVLEKIKKEEEEAKRLLEITRNKEKQEHINKVLDELRGGTHLVLIPHDVKELSDTERRKLLRQSARELRGTQHASLQDALRTGASRKHHGHFEKLRLAKMLMSSNTLRRCFLRWERQVARWLELRKTMFYTLNHLFNGWKLWYKHNMNLKRRVATSMQNFYAMYIGHAFQKWWKKTRRTFSVKTASLKTGAVVTYIERRDDFNVVANHTLDGAKKVKGDIVKRYLVDIQGRQPVYDMISTRRRLHLHKLADKEDNISGATHVREMYARRRSVLLDRV